MNPDIPDEAAAELDALEDVDEGIEVNEEDPTVFVPDTESPSTIFSCTLMHTNTLTLHSAAFSDRTRALQVG